MTELDRVNIQTILVDPREFIDGFWNTTCRNLRCTGKKGTGCSSADEHAKAARARPRERDRPVLRLFSSMAKKSAVFEACTRCCFVERPCPGDRGPGCESKLRGVGTRRVWRKNCGQGRGD